MADFAEWVVACEPALPWEEGAFLKAYLEAQGHLVEESIEADLVASALVTLTHRAPDWSGTSSQLLDTLNRSRGSDVVPARGWPTSPRGLSDAVKRAAPLLRRVGIEIYRTRRGDQGRARLIHLTRTEPETASQGKDQRQRAPERPDRPNRPEARADKDSGLDGADGSDGSLHTRANQSAPVSPPPDLGLWDDDPMVPKDEDLLGEKDGLRI